MHNSYYLLFNLAVFVPTVLLSLFTDVKLHRAWSSFLMAVLIVSVPFVAWDFWATSAAHWGFNSEYVFSPRIRGVPLEELFFFVTVPFAMMYVWGVIQKHVRERVLGWFWPALALGLALASSLYLLVVYWGNGYTRSAALMLIGTIVVFCFSRLIFLKTFWAYQLLLLTLFIIGNSVLTALPIITYGDNAITGFRFGTIPLEDFLYNFAFLNLFLLVFEWSVPRRLR